jgi:hypothetical protein
VLGGYELYSEIARERRRAKEEKATGLSHRDVAHQQAQIRSATRPGSAPSK